MNKSTGRDKLANVPVSNELKVVFVQAIIPKYRSDFLKRLSEFTKLDILALCGNVKSKKHRKICNYGKIEGFTYKALWAPLLIFHVRGNVYPVYFFPTLIWHLLKFRPKVVVVEGAYLMLNNFFVIIYAKLFGAKVIWWSLGKVVTRPKTIVNTFVDWFIKWGLLNCHFIVGKNTQACRYYQKKYGVPADRTSVAPNTIDDIEVQAEIERNKDEVAALREQLDSEVNVLYVGAMEKTKRLEDLIEAMEYVWDKCSSAKLILVGEGESKSDLEKMVRNLKREDNVIFTGKLLEGVSKYFLLADVFVLPGQGGLAIPHAMIHGVPVIARVADGTEIDLVKNAVTGYLLDNNSNKELAEKILAIVTQPQLQMKMRANCRDFIETQWNIRLQVKAMHKAVVNVLKVQTTLGKCIKQSNCQETDMTVVK